MRRTAINPARLALLSLLGALALGIAPASATFEGSNGLIAYSRVFFTRDSEIFTVSPRGGELTPLTRNEQNDFNPAWSPNGLRLAFESSGNDVDIWVIRATGGRERNLTQNPNGPDLGPAWSPDGEHIAFWRQSFLGTGSVWRMEADGSNPVRLTRGTTVNMQPAWSTDGSTIAFTSDRDGNLELYLMDADGTNERRLTNTPGIHEENPNWSPDGRWLAFDACADDFYPCSGTPNYEIFKMRPNGNDRTRLTHVENIDAHPSWSPNGRRIAFRSDRLGYTALWVMREDGTRPQLLTPEEMQGGVDPDWQPVQEG